MLIDIQRGFVAAADWFTTDPDVGVPGFVVMELVQDARNSDEVEKAAGRSRRSPRRLSVAEMAGLVMNLEGFHYRILTGR